MMSWSRISDVVGTTSTKFRCRADPTGTTVQFVTSTILVDDEAPTAVAAAGHHLGWEVSWLDQGHGLWSGGRAGKQTLGKAGKRTEAGRKKTVGLEVEQ